MRLVDALVILRHDPQGAYAREAIGRLRNWMKARLRGKARRVRRIPARVTSHFHAICDAYAAYQAMGDVVLGAVGHQLATEIHRAMIEESCKPLV
jgi:hypothetical protein